VRRGAALAGASAAGAADIFARNVRDVQECPVSAAQIAQSQDAAFLNNDAVLARDIGPFKNEVVDAGLLAYLERQPGHFNSLLGAGFVTNDKRRHGWKLAIGTQD